MWARRCRPRTYPHRAFPFDLSCRPGNLSPATSRPGFPGFVAGENGKCCSVGPMMARLRKEIKPRPPSPSPSPEADLCYEKVVPGNHLRLRNPLE
ncbi:hypothetical protein Tco_1513019, partial [Tanacetum coccineum]